MRITSYVYYKDKCDMLSQIYMEAKEIVDKGLNLAIQRGGNVEEKLFYAISFLTKSVLEHPLEANYVMAFKNNKELLSKEAAELAKLNMKPLADLCREAYQNGDICIQNPNELNALLIAPIYWMIEENRELTYDDLEPLIRTCNPSGTDGYIYK